MRIVNLASGSKANSTFVEYGESKILIDVGLSEKLLKERLEELDENLSNIIAVCITHEHSDHIKSLKTLARKYDMDFYVHEKLANSGFLSDIVFKAGKLHTFNDEMFSILNLEILPFATSHDAISPVGFTINVKGSASKFGIVTDTGTISQKMRESLAGSKIVFIESNYDEEMLFTGFYPMQVKNRIASSIGHLSNAQSLEFAEYLYESGTKCFVLSHLSENCNTQELAYVNFVNYFQNKGLSLDKDVFIRLSYQNKHGNKFNLKEEFYG